MFRQGTHAVFFDLDGTLLMDHPSPAAQFVAYCERLGHPVDVETYRRVERWRHEYWSKRQQVEADLLTGRDRFWRMYHLRQLELIDMAGPLDDHAAQIERWFDEEFLPGVRVADQAPETLAYLRQRGLTVGLVSNRNRSLEPVVAEHGFDGLFDFTLAAGEAGSWKPDPDIFLRALEMAGAPPEAAAYVGDNYYADVVGARAAGLTPVLVDRRGVFPDADCDVIREIGELRGWV